jgi:hypothetical protein
VRRRVYAFVSDWDRRKDRTIILSGNSGFVRALKPVRNIRKVLFLTTEAQFFGDPGGLRRESAKRDGNILLRPR